ncbi:MAG TPA: hypothetical protein DEA08_29235 [Planctomycetes bacterium]|nr:hypothetical protein [Planctomycetota bacterium]
MKEKGTEARAASKPALVTGATGFIGGHLVDGLLAAGRPVRALVRSPGRAQHLAERGVELVEGNLADTDSLRRGCEGVGEVYHLAAMLRAPWRSDFAEVNALGCGNVAAACAAQPEPPAMILVSSLAAAGPGPAARDERAPARPVSRYGAAKLAGERAAAEHELPLTIVRPPMVLGPGDRASLRLFRMVSRGNVVAPGRAPLALVDVRDLCALLIAAGERGERVGGSPGAGVYYAAYPEAFTLAELGQQIAAALGRRAPRAWRIPLALTWLAAGGGELFGRLRDQPTLLNLDKARELAGGAWCCSVTKAEEQLGFAHAPLEQRLRETVDWYRAEGWL